MSFNGGLLAEGINTGEARTLNGEGRYQELLDMAARSNGAGRPTQFRRLTLLVPFHRSLLCWFYLSISITAVVICASVDFIPFAPKQQKTDFIACVAWSVIAGFVVCIGSYAILIIKSLQFVRQPRPQEKGEQVDG